MKMHHELYEHFHNGYRTINFCTLGCTLLEYKQLFHYLYPILLKYDGNVMQKILMHTELPTIHF